MDRKKFLSSIGSTAACICVGAMASCVKATSVPTNSSNSLTVDLSSQLLQVGDYLVITPVAIVRIGPGFTNSAFSVLGTTCPHAGYTVNYEPTLPDPTAENTTGIFRCPGHGSLFEKNGNRISGPTPRGLSTIPFSIAGYTMTINT